jgi:hypothetical protein
LGEQSREWLVPSDYESRKKVKDLYTMLTALTHGTNDDLTKMVTMKLIQTLNGMLEEYIVSNYERKKIITDLVTLLTSQNSVSYSLDDHHSIILIKDDQELSRLRKYEDSPLPYLSNLELFSSIVGR